MNSKSAEELVRSAYEAAENAYAPFSKFRVGAAILTDDGSVFTGCNVENSSYGLTICAERNAVFSAVAEGHRKIKAVAIAVKSDAIPYPCGACRQVIAEFADVDCPVYVASAGDPPGIEKTTIGSLLPYMFRL